MNSHKLLFLVLILAVCLTQFATDIYVPALPSIAKNLQAPIHLVQWTMALYMLGVALSQLVYGPLSDGIGRKPPLLLGLAIMLIGSQVCFLAPNIQTLLLGRFIQGCGAGACAALWRSIFRDIFTGKELAKYGSNLVTFIMFIVPAAPILGGYLQHYLGWRANFGFMSIYTFFALGLIIYGFKETSQHHHKEKLNLNYILNTYTQLVVSPIFMGTTSSTFLSYGAVFAWLTTGPILLIHVIGISPVAFGWISFLAAGIAYVIAGRLNSKLVLKVGMVKMMRFGWSIMGIASIMLLIGKLLLGINLYIIVIPIILFYFGSTFIWPNAFAIAFTPFGQVAGFAGALYGFMQICGAAFLGALMTYLSYTSQLPLALLMLSSSLLAWAIFELSVVPKLTKT